MVRINELHRILNCTFNFSNLLDIKEKFNMPKLTIITIRLDGRTFQILEKLRY